ncbi:MAG: HAMP domain-containing protein [Zetaproteobacteria bacterium]|nr:MAG: HAMP domain-containing protein [Zetaproteobacteria bacterium]
MRFLPLLMAAALLSLIALLWPVARGGLLMAWINVAILSALAVLLLQYGIRLLRRRGAPPPGSRLRAKLVIAMVGMLMVPSLLIQLSASQMVERGMDVWFDLRVDTLLERALKLAQGFYDRIDLDMKRGLRDYVADPELISALGTEVPFGAANGRLREILVKEGWDRIQLFDINERMVADVRRDGLIDVHPAPLSEAARLVMQLGNVSTEIVTDGDVEKAIGYAPVLGQKGSVGLLRVELKLPEGVIRSARLVESDYQNYRALEHNRHMIKDLFANAMLFVTLVLVMLASVMALWFARRLTAPIGELAAALHRVTEGDLNVAIPASSQDELGSLAESFNQMAERLRQNAAAIDKAQRDLTHALANSRQRQYILETLLANLHTGVLLIDANGSIRLLNQSLRDILPEAGEWRPGMALQTHCIGPLRFLGEFYADMRARDEAALQRQFDLAGRHVLVRGARLELSGMAEFSGELIMVDDITELVNAQRHQAWAEVAQRLAHEIKNPLTPIKLSAERLQRRFRRQVDAQDVFDSCTQAIVTQVARLQRLIADFSSLARMPQPKIEQVRVADIMRDMRELFNAYPALSFVEPEASLTCYCDADQVRQVLINLLDNALAAIGDDGRVTLEVGKTDQWVEWHVLDDGPGVPEEIRQQVFEAYFSTKASGSGLGLAIARRIAEDHGGELCLISARNPTHFCLRLPRRSRRVEEGV